MIKEKLNKLFHASDPLKYKEKKDIFFMYLLTIMDTPIVFATHIENSSIPIAKPIPISPMASAPPLETMYIPHPPNIPPPPKHMNRYNTVYVETNNRDDTCDNLCTILLCCCLIQNLTE